MWTLGGIRIFVEEYAGNSKQTIAEINPLRAGSIYQTFGWQDKKKKLSGIIVGIDDRDHLESLTTSGESFLLNTPDEGSGYYFVENVEYKRNKTISQTLRTDLECEAPVYQVEVDLILDVD